MTEIDTCLVVRMILVTIPYIAVFVDVLKVVVTLKQAVMPNYPIVPFTDIWTKNFRSYFAMIIWSQYITDIM